MVVTSVVPSALHTAYAIPTGTCAKLILNPYMLEIREVSVSNDGESRQHTHIGVTSFVSYLRRYMAQAKPNSRLDFKSRDCFETDVAQLSKMTVRINTTQHAFEEETILWVSEGITVDEANTAPPLQLDSAVRAAVGEEEQGTFATFVRGYNVGKRRFIGTVEYFILDDDDSWRVKGNPLA